MVTGGGKPLPRAMASLWLSEIATPAGGLGLVMVEGVDKSEKDEQWPPIAPNPAVGEDSVVTVLSTCEEGESNGVSCGRSAASVAAAGVQVFEFFPSADSEASPPLFSPPRGSTVFVSCPPLTVVVLVFCFRSLSMMQHHVQGVGDAGELAATGGIVGGIGTSSWTATGRLLCESSGDGGGVINTILDFRPPRAPAVVT